MTWLFTRPPSVAFFVNVRSTLLEGDEWKEPFIETCIDEKLPWAATPARRSFRSFPPEESFPELVAEFQSWIEDRRAPR